MAFASKAGKYNFDGRTIFMLISYVIPAFNTSSTISRVLDSIFRCMSDSWQVEAIVVDDGSNDGVDLAIAVANYPKARLVVHETNKGMCAGRNSGILASLGDIVIILDADDELVDSWPLVLEKIVREWPLEANVCYAACKNTVGVVTAQEPDYQGFLSLQDILNERHTGEYIPLFRGDYVRPKPYVDLNMRKSCGIVSYINFAQDGPFWVTNSVFRIYHDQSTGSVSQGWTAPKKAAETVECYKKLFELYESQYLSFAPKVYKLKLLKLAVYMKLAGIPGAWKEWRKGASFSVLKETVGAAVLLMVGLTVSALIILTIKKIGLVKRYG